MIEFNVNDQVEFRSMENPVRLGEAERTSNATSPSGGERSAEGTAPLSYSQEQIWSHAQILPEIPIYNEPVTIHRSGILSVTALQQALTEIVRRHQAWRTSFKLVHGEPLQVVAAATPVDLREVDLSHLPPSRRESKARKLAFEDVVQPFDLSQGPLFRCLLVHLSEKEHRLFLTLHHIIFDGYSIYRVFLPELAALYDAFAHGWDSPLAEIASQYPDFSRWQRERLMGEKHLSSQLAYWRQQLKDLPVLQLPSYLSRPPVQSFRGAIGPFALSAEVCHKLKLLSRSESATLFMGLSAAFALLLQRYSCSDEVVIGTVSSGRKRSELEGLLGYFLNPVVMRHDLSGNPTFRKLLRRTRELTLDALSNDDAPFTHVVNELHPDRSLRANPLFQVLLTLEPPPAASPDGWAVELTQSELDTGFCKLDLCLELDERPTGGLLGRFKYSEDLFERETIARMGQHLNRLLESAVAMPDECISNLSMLTEVENARLCIEAHSGKSETPEELRVHRLFATQAQITPEAVALVDDNRQWSYRELDDASDRWAAYLQTRGVGPEKPVGLYFEPSWEMVVAILAVLKAGGACVPLDPSYPAERHAHVLADTRMTLILSQSRLRFQPREQGIELLHIDSRIHEGVRGSLLIHIGLEDTAYIIYTSGSTGKPKGVQITHANLGYSTHARFLYYGAESVRFLLLSSFAFDSSLAGIFSTLCYGGTLVLTPGPLQSNLAQLAALVEKHGVSHLLCVPSLYRLILEQAGQRQLATLRVAIVAGEACPGELVERHFKQIPQAALYNEYGPTESTVWATVHKCQLGSSQKTVPIGRPIPHAHAYVLDPQMSPLPPGMPGELYLGGPCVARGYLNLPAETSERFVPDRFSQQSHARLYKTGDRVRLLPDENLEILGRLDHQVKIRGFRIEPGEIEAVIQEYEGVRQTVVVLDGEQGADPRLVAYVVPNDLSNFDREGLRVFLEQKLPQAMIPAILFLLQSLPLMPNGKVNRRALPVVAQTVSQRRCLDPDNELELKLLQLWQDLLGKRGFGVTENFFDLGGHSLLAAKLLLRIHRQFGRRFSLADLFKAPTVRQLAKMLADRRDSNSNPAVVPVQADGFKPPLFWVRGGSFLLTLAKRLGADQPILGLHLPASDAVQLPVPARLEDIAMALVARMREVQEEGPYYLAGLCVNGVIAYEMARQLSLQNQIVALLCLFDSQNPAYYENFSEETRTSLLRKRVAYHWGKLGRQKLSGFFAERVVGMRRHLSVRYWRMHHALKLKVSEKQLQDLDVILHPASFVYRPQPYYAFGCTAFFQSSDWPEGPYWDFSSSWHGLIEPKMQVFKVPGGHESMFYDQNVNAIASALKNCLSEAKETSLVA